MQRRRAIGAEVTGGGVSFRVWAPEHDHVAVVIGGRDISLERETGGYFCAVVAEAAAGTLYRFRLGDDPFPDPASRFQPEGVHGPSQVVDPSQYEWRDAHWPGITAKDRVVYELHVGTFTPEGTYRAAIRHFPTLAEIGINTIELMPVNEFGGDFGWGYDGVDLWAPTRLYGTPDDLRAFVDAAHAHDIGVILDVVYNHLGPDGNTLTKFARDYFTDKYDNEWGEPLNFENRAVREFFVENAAYWIDEFHFDGLRLDATQSMFDASERHVLRDITESARNAARRRSVYLVGENEPQDRIMLTDYGLDALWNDDWHHAARVALTGRHEAYYSDYRGRAQEFVSMARLGFLYQGQRYAWQKKRRGTPSRDLAPERFVCYLDNHDQIANSGSGARIHQTTDRGLYKALTALLLLQPQTPMLFQGQEFGAQSPFVYFAHHTGELVELVEKGRGESMEQFPSLKGLPIPPPHERATLEMCVLDHSRRDAEIETLHRELLALRRQMPPADGLEGATLSEQCLVLRWFADDDRLLIVNLGADLHLEPAPEPLLASPRGWRMLWATGHMPEPEQDGVWHIPGHCAILLTPQ